MARPKKSQEQLDKDAEVFSAICARLSKGEPLAVICRDEGMPAVRTVNDWAQSKPEFGAMFARARDDGFDAIAADAFVIQDQEPERTPTEHGEKVDAGYVAWQKNRVETRLKLLAKWDPRRYGDKLAVGGAADLPPVRTESTVTLDPSEAYKKLLGGS